MKICYLLRPLTLMHTQIYLNVLRKIYFWKRYFNARSPIWEYKTCLLTHMEYQWHWWMTISTSMMKWGDEWTPPGTVNKHALEREGIIFYLRSKHDLNPDPKRPLSLVIRSEIIPLWHAPRCVKLSWRAFVTNTGFLIFKSRTRNVLQTELNLHSENLFFFTT